MNTKMLIRAVVMGCLTVIALMGFSEDNAPKENTNEQVAITGAGMGTPPKAFAAPNPDLPPLPIEPTGQVLTLPSDYPEGWMLVDEGSFTSMFGGKIILMDVAEPKPAKRIKAIADKNLLGNFIQAKVRNEMYVIETFHERGSRGKRTDVLAIYDTTTMSIVKELLWTNTTRLMAMPERYAMALTPDERFLMVANFSPAASFTVVDLDQREIITTIDTPGCVLTYPTGKRSVASLCSNGAMLTTVLDSDGRKKSQHRMKPFFDTDKTPIYERPAIIDGIAYFPSFTGLIHAIDLRGEKAKYLENWSLVSEQEQQDNWRPSGLALVDSDEQGRFYILMNPGGHEGTQTHGSKHVWVFDMHRKQKVRSIDLPNIGISIAVSRGKEPKLVVTNGDMNLDIINADSAKHIHTISDFGNVTPLMVNKAY